MFEQEFLPYGRHDIDEADIQAVVDALKSGTITQGKYVTAFEKSLRESTQAKHAFAVSNGTAALHLAAMVLDIGPGDEILTTPNTFVASGNCALYCGARVGFVDIDSESLGISPQLLKEELAARERAGRTMPKAIVNVLFAGNPTHAMDIYELAQKYGIPVIEDACHALGGEYEKNNPIGSGQYSDLSILSFHPVKHITTGEGGAVLTRSPQLAGKLRALRTHGIVRDGFIAGTEADPWYYEMQYLGYNYRITDIQCALGARQMEKLPRYIRRRQEIARQYDVAFQGLPGIRTPQTHPGHAYHLYVLQVAFEDLGVPRREFMNHLKERGVGTQVHYIPMYRQPYYQKQYGLSISTFPSTESYYAQCISIPIFPTMTDGDVKRVVTSITEVLTRSRR